MTSRSSVSRKPVERGFWHSSGFRALIYQCAILAGIGVLVFWLVDNTLINLAARNISTGFGFLGREAGFAISETPVAYSPADTYASALLVGILNTLKVAAIGIVLATILGTCIGIARLSTNRLLAAVAVSYIEVIRNIPLLLQLFFWYALMTQSLPVPRQAFEPLEGIFLSNRGLTVPWLESGGGVALWAALAFGLLLSLIWRRAFRTFPARRRIYYSGGFVLVWLLMLAGTVLLFEPAFHLSVPALKGFNFRGGATLSPEFCALLLGLVLYTSAFVAEVVRSGIQAVTQGQWNAGRALGLQKGQVLRFIVLPQALRVIVPPMTSQYLNLTKNSSLAVAIGYPDIVSIANTTLNQTGQAIEGVLIIMAAYLTVSLAISAVMNAYNRRIALKER